MNSQVPPALLHDICGIRTHAPCGLSPKASAFDRSAKVSLFLGLFWGLGCAYPCGGLESSALLLGDIVPEGFVRQVGFMVRILPDERNQLPHAKLLQHRDNRMTRGTRRLPLPAAKYLDHLVQTAITDGN